ncbi:MAG: YbgF trimerization domain-containing protein [Methylophilaceae bacterium]
MNKLQKSLFVGLSLFVLSSQAALFDDKEARKKILGVQAESEAGHDAQAAEIEDLKKRLTIHTQGLLDMQNEIELLTQEVAQLRGGLEVANHALETSEQRQKDLYADTDARLRKLEGVGSVADSDSGTGEIGPMTEAEDQKAYKKAYAFSQGAKHKEAFSAYDAFIKAYPDSKLVPDALYGLGYSQFALKSYKSSISSQQKLLKTYPDSPKVPNAIYSIANSQIQLGRVKSARTSLRNLIAKYPDADVTPNAKKRLKVLETIK